MVGSIQGGQLGQQAALSWPGGGTRQAPSSPVVQLEPVEDLSLNLGVEPEEEAAHAVSERSPGERGRGTKICFLHEP